MQQLIKGSELKLKA